MPEDVNDPDFIAEETDDETELSTYEDPEEIEENELKVRAVLGSVLGTGLFGLCLGLFGCLA